MIGLLASIKSGITTLTGRLTSTRAGYLDNLDAAVTTRLGSIKSIQSGTIAVNVSSNTALHSATASISSVNAAKSIVLLLGHGMTGTQYGPLTTARVELTNGTTVTAYAGHSQAIGTGAMVAYQVIEFN